MKGVNLGKPLSGLAVWASAYGKTQGRDRIYAVSSGSPCMLHVIDPHGETGVESFPLEGSDHSWGVVYAESGVYIGGSGILYRYTHEGGVEDLGVMIPGEFYSWRLAADDAGMIYGGLYPGGKVFQYNPLTGEFRDYGVMVPGEQYARSMEACGGKLYVGIGTLAPHIVELDTQTGSRHEISLPEECRGQQLVYDLDIVQKKLFARVTPSSLLYVYDLELGQWVDRIEGAGGLSVSPPDERGGVYLVKDGFLHRYDRETRALQALSLLMPEPAGDYGWLEGHALNPEGRCLAGVHRDGSYWVYDPVQDRHVTCDPELEGQPVQLQSLACGPEGVLYAG